MRASGVSTRRRAGRLLTFAALLGLLLAIVPVLAWSEPEQPPIPPLSGEGQAAQEAEEAPVPTTAEITGAYEAARRKEEEREEMLARPAAVEEREASQHAYANLGPAEAEGLLSAKFSEALAALNADPARALTDSRLDQPLGNGDAVVTNEGKTQLLEGTYPVETKNEEGELEKVDLSLEKTAEGYAPENPLVEVTIPEAAAEGVEIGGESREGQDEAPITVTQVGAEGSTARAFGDKNVFFNEVEPGSATDLLVAPTTNGVELFDLLRSADSPETLRFQVQLPPGDELRASAGGGAEVLAADGTSLYAVPRPGATDGQGTYVSTTLEVEGDEIVLRVPHREQEPDYPLLVDPEFEQVFENWNQGNLPGIAPGGPWYPYQSSPNNGIPYGTSDNYWPGLPGLYFAAQEGSLGANIWTELAYFPPNEHTYIAKAAINTFVRGDFCSPLKKDPYDFTGMYIYSNNGTPTTPTWNGYRNNDAYNYGNSLIEAWGNEFIIGYGNSSARWNECWRNVRVGGAQIWLEDWQYPYINSATGAPSGWIKKDNTKRTLNVSASDEGLGIKVVRLIAPGGKESPWNKPICAGTYESPCRNSESGVVTYETSQFPFEGETSMGLVAEDPTKKKWSEQFPVKLDGTPPKVALNGQLARITEETGEKEKPQSEGSDKLSLPVYNLKVTAEDGTEAEPRSGVKEIKLYLDGSETPLKTMMESCSSTCPQTATLEYPVALTGLSEGTHKLEIEATDLVGNSATRSQRKIEFEYIPATGMKEEYVLQHFAIPDGHSYAEEPEYQGPELAVNVTNGNVVFHERDFKVQSDRASLELERVYNSQLPAARDGQWGHGWSLKQAPELKPQGTEPKATMVRTGAITSPVNLPESKTQPTFSQKLHAQIAKTGGGGYEVAYKTAPEVSVFSSSGQIQETRLGEGEATSVQGESALQEGPTFSSAFGTGGAGNGQFAHPGDVAIDAKGNLWVADENNNRLQEFNQKGEFLKTLGSAGTGNGQFTRPKSIAFDAKGNMWVADSGNSRFEEFSEKGEFVKAVGSAGSANGQFSGPESLAIDAKGNLWVADTYNHRIQELNEKGEFIAVVNPSGLGAIEPTGVDVGPHGNVWVADWAHNRVVELSGEGSLIRQFGTSGTGNGQFQHPDAVSVDSRGSIWVTDQNNARVQQFNQSGEYLGQFGSAGTGSGQFSFGYPTGMAVDSKGGIWITDTGNNRIQKWTVPGYAPTYVSSFGSAGTGNGQFAHPADVATDPEGHLWVVDENNKRVEEFSSGGEYLGKFGSTGTGNGQFSQPTSIAISPLGNIWVADAGDCRLEEFSPSGEYMAKTGTCGAGNGQFSEIEGIAIDPKGNIWVADTYNARIQELNEKGAFIRAVGSAGSGPGQLCEPTEIATGPGGNVWTTEWCNNRVSEFNENGEFVRSFGSAGAGNGQFSHPDGIEVDRNGNSWVGDEGNRRVQEFSPSGEYISQFGSAGTGNGQFSLAYPMGIASDSLGHLWVTDAGNNRVQKFSASDSIGPSAAPAFKSPTIKYSYSGSALTGMTLEDEASETNPAMSVSTASGLTTGVNAEAAGTATLAYESNKLTSEKDPEGEVKYEYDSSSRLKKVTLPNGNWASIVYDSASRATEVTVHAEGASKTIHFWYGLEPHETKVWGGGNPEIVYSIGEDGSVFKWAYAETPPTITSVSGSLWGNRNSTTPVENKDQTLYVHASSPHEIASIKVVENGRAILAETTCEDPSEPPKHNCDEPPPLEWITNPAAHAPGQLNLEVVATDFLGHSTAESFFVTMPQQPPPEPEAPERPDFEAVKQFRADYGLDREHPLTEQQMNTLILELLYEWELGEQTAVTAVDNWGVPMRAPELAEMEWRREYTDRAAEVIPEWAEEHAPTSYGGFYINDKEGGIIYVGFTENQHGLVEALKQDSRLLNAGAIREYPIPPTVATYSLEATAPTVTSAITAEPSIAELTTAVRVDEESNKVVVGATNPAVVREFIHSQFGAGAPIVVEAAQHDLNAASRYGVSGPVVAGTAIYGPNLNICTAGYGARAPAGELRGQSEYKYFVTTAGHCFPLNMTVSRELKKEGLGPEIGTVRRNPFGSVSLYPTDAAGILLADENLRSHSVLNKSPLEVEPIQGAQAAHKKEHVCWSGVNGNNHCGWVLGIAETYLGARVENLFLVKGVTVQGDSGGPVWDPETHKAVGLITVASSEDGGKCWETYYGALACTRMKFTPLVTARGVDGALPELGVEILKQGGA